MKRATFGLSEEHTTSSTEWFGMKVGCWHWFVFRSFWAHSAKLRCCPWTVVTFKTNHPKKSISAGQLSTHSRLSRFFLSVAGEADRCRHFFLEFKFHGLLHNMYQYVISFCNTRKTLKDDQLHWGCVSCSPWGSVTEEDPEFLREALLRSMPNAVQCGSCHYGPIDHAARLQLMWMAMAKTWKQKKNRWLFAATRVLCQTWVFETCWLKYAPANECRCEYLSLHDPAMDRCWKLGHLGKTYSFFGETFPQKQPHDVICWSLFPQIAHSFETSTHCLYSFA